jgi:hypothetical protein
LALCLVSPRLNSALLGVKPDAFMPAAILRNTHGGAGTLAGDAPV